MNLKILLEIYIFFLHTFALITSTFPSSSEILKKRFKRQSCYFHCAPPFVLFFSPCTSLLFVGQKFIWIPSKDINRLIKIFCCKLLTLNLTLRHESFYFDEFPMKIIFLQVSPHSRTVHLHSRV